MLLAQDGSDYPFLDLMWTMIVFFAWVIWFWLLITILGDLFRRADISGWGKAGWTLLVVFLPFLGVLLYLVVHGKQMGERRRAEAQEAQQHFDDYVRSVATPQPRATEQIAKAKELLDRGAIDDTEYEALKRKALAT
ncbi:SHOCT domain-containing protein [Prauserella flavalba]|uniref:Phospholipase D-like protein n=1 Tax=Prauserella flavalba TaxID=1477506 RepID=A0A318LDB9_9PSEU|nr:SHOCT domain-containing protein [Prauserella flavalba]PXY24070.1 hypothetical protein BA062_27855 [Prauserella flavalba]